MERVIIWCVLYLRMSHDDQDRSIEDQRAACLAYAESKGYKVLREYVDEGLSGSKENVVREAFLKMIADSGAGGFTVIVCWDMARFSRLDTISVGNNAKDVLRKKNIILNTVKEGEFDWNTPMGRMKNFMLAENANAYSRSLSCDTLRGRERTLEGGGWPHGRIPYGFDRLVDMGCEIKIIPRMEPFRKSKHWKLTLAENKAEASVVKYIFERYVTHDESMRSIAQRLNKEGITGPDGNGPWQKDNVKRRLQCPAYIGLAVIGGEHVRKSTFAFNRATKTVKEGVCPALVDADLWRRAQEKMAKYSGHAHTGRSQTLSGLLKCGHCGYRMTTQGKRGSSRYVCSAASRGKSVACHQWAVIETDVLPAVCKKIVEVVDAHLLAALQAHPPEVPVTDLEIAVAHVETLRKSVQEAGRTFLTRPDLRASLESPMKQMQEELARAEEALLIREKLESAIDSDKFNDWWQGVRDTLVHIPATWGEPERDEECDWTVQERKTPPVDIEPGVFRNHMKEMGLVITCFWIERKGKGRKLFELDYARLNIEIEAKNFPGRGNSIQPGKSIRIEAEIRFREAA